MRFSFIFSSFLALTSILTSLQSFSQTQENTKPLAIGQILTIDSKILEEERILNIYLPENYENSDKKYPVIYLLDGSIDQDFLHIAGLVQFNSLSWINVIPECIVVGIANVDRKRDFSHPTSIKRDKKDFPSSGGSQKFISFIENELKERIESQYRANNESYLIGQSLGGLLATEILLNKTELFDHYIIVSPSLWWDNGSVLKTSLTHHSPKSISIAVGKEGEILENNAKELYMKLVDDGYPKGNLYFKYLENRNHGDALHMAVYNIFEHLSETNKKKNQ
ncbi:alpha/beta hydrolase [Aureibacter tunicatorum]|uniref:Esterase n=1 Tax=Aureibacter tunicatorum TaxID=866807 RepID=A0AAE3XQZ9_9BACT|nr:alpha/beta hydrolase-fold protein [Aureibacter tunicatorum]MDR6241070.1 hypothetical protein [Aureibacter tunicatorum]BDD03848.1 esterase [Aureibacter tunicatorum]